MRAGFIGLSQVEAQNRLRPLLADENGLDSRQLQAVDIEGDRLRPGFLDQLIKMGDSEADPVPQAGLVKRWRCTLLDPIEGDDPHDLRYPRGLWIHLGGRLL